MYQRPLNATVSTARTCGSGNQGMEAGVDPFGIVPSNSLTEILLFVLPTISCAGLDILVFKGECFHKRTQHHTDILSHTTEPIALLHLGFGLTHTMLLSGISSLKFPISLHSSKYSSDHCVFTKPCGRSPAPRDLPFI